MPQIRLIAGLGNPTREHERDRHNAGFWLVERLARALGVSLAKESKFAGLVGRGATPLGDVWLVLPQTYMNLSGRSVGALARFYRIPPEATLVVHDELDLPAGAARLKQGGGVAGHNGLKDIAAQLGSQSFWRLRLGIGHPGDRNRVADYVLSSPPAAEREAIEQAIERALEVMPMVVAGELETAMHRLHSKPKPEKPAADVRPEQRTAKSRVSENDPGPTAPEERK